MTATTGITAITTAATLLSHLKILTRKFKTLAVEDRTVTLTADNGTISATLPAQIEAPDAKATTGYRIGFNPKHLLEALESMEGGTIIIALNAPDQPAMFYSTACHGTPDAKGCTITPPTTGPRHLLMPVRLPG